MKTIEKKVFDKRDFKKKVCLVLGTRPGIVMFSPIIKAMQNYGIPFFIVHTGQHYSPNMDHQFFDDLKLPSPDYKIENVAEKKMHGAQTAAMLEGIESVLVKELPKIVLVGGDANTNLAGALAARKLRMTVGHVEAGERSFDWRMPEEHNRRVIDHISDLLFATGKAAEAHLKDENIQGEIYITGNTIVDASLQNLEIARSKTDTLNKFSVSKDQYALLTTHREENVDFYDSLRSSLQGVSHAAQKQDLPVVFLAHPRTIKRLKEFDLWDWAKGLQKIYIHEAVGYLDFIHLIAHARLVFTDSGGVQQEACIHKIPAVTLRENTEWMETLEHGANRLAGTDPDRIAAAAREALSVPRDWPIPFGDGQAAMKIARICRDALNVSDE